MGLVGRTTAELIVALGVASAPAGAQARLAQLDSANRWVDSIFAPYSSTSSPGCAVGVVRDGQLAFAKGYGMADLEHDTPITPSTRFYIASLSSRTRSQPAPPCLMRLPASARLPRRPRRTGCMVRKPSNCSGRD